MRLGVLQPTGEEKLSLVIKFDVIMSVYICSWRIFQYIPRSLFACLLNVLLLFKMMWSVLLHPSVAYILNFKFLWRRVSVTMYISILSTTSILLLASCFFHLVIYSYCFLPCILLHASYWSQQFIYCTVIIFTRYNIQATFSLKELLPSLSFCRLDYLLLMPLPCILLHASYHLGNLLIIPFPCILSSW